MSLSNNKSDMSLSNDDLLETHKNAHAAGRSVDLYVTVVLEQPEFPPLQKAKNLQAHQKTAKANAQTWRDTVRAALCQTNSNLNFFCNTFDSLYEPLYEFAQKIVDDPNDKQAQGKFVNGINSLLKEIEANKSDCEDAAKKLKEFHAKVSRDEANFKADQFKVEAIYKGDKKKLEELKGVISSLKRDIDKDTFVIAAGSLAVVAGAGLAIVVGALVFIPTLGGSTPLIIGGIGVGAAAGAGVVVAAGGAVAIGYAAKDISSKAKEYSKCTEDLALLDAEMAVAITIASQLESMIVACEQATAALNTMTKTWEALLSGFQSFTTVFDCLNPKVAELLKALLDGARNFWRNVAQTAKIIHDQMTTEVIVDVNKPLVFEATPNVAQSHTVARESITTTSSKK